MKNKYSCKINETKLEITNEYQYLGLKLRPSGSLTQAVQELHDKASRAWFGISNIIFKNKKMEAGKVFGLFDSLISPVATYGSVFWLPMSLKNQLSNQKLDFWIPGNHLNVKHLIKNAAVCFSQCTRKLPD